MITLLGIFGACLSKRLICWFTQQSHPKQDRQLLVAGSPAKMRLLLPVTPWMVTDLRYLEDRSAHYRVAKFNVSTFAEWAGLTLCGHHRPVANGSHGYSKIWTTTFPVGQIRHPAIKTANAEPFRYPTISQDVPEYQSGK
jgi:hypothetical protein